MFRILPASAAAWILACHATHPTDTQMPPNSAESAAEGDVGAAAPNTVSSTSDSVPDGCDSPARSPGPSEEGVIVCRNRLGDILVATGQGLRLLHTNVHPDPVKWTPDTPNLPPAVRFESATTLLVDWNNGRPVERLSFGALPVVPRAAVPARAPRPLAERLASCATDNDGEPWEVATACPPNQLNGFPALSADGKHLFAVEEWQSCCADMAKHTLLEYEIADGAVSHPKRTLLWEFDQETGKPTLSPEESERRMAALNLRTAELLARPLARFPKDGTRALRLSPDEVVIADGPAARVLKNGVVEQTLERSPFALSGFCCNGEMPAPDTAPIQCEAPAFLSRAWLAPEARLLVTETHNHEGADGCEQGPRIDVFRLHD